MQVIKPSTLSLLKQTYDFQGHQFVVSALSFFQLGKEPTLLEENAQWLRLQPYLSKGIVLDTGHAKGRSECLLAGKAFAKEAKPIPEMMVHFKMGDVAKSVRVVGNRTCRSGGLLRSRQVSAPEPFIQMPLGDAESYGGKGFTENPKGKGVLNKANFDREKEVYHLANLYLAKESIEPDTEKRRVASFLPRELTHPQRAQYQGTYDQHWLDHIQPGFPHDTDPRLFNVAPPEQQRKGDFLPSEHYALSGFHPEKSRIEGHLPNVLVRAFVTQEHHEHSEFIEIPTHIDTVWFFPELELGIAIHRGVLPAYDSAGLDIKNLLLALENVGDKPRDKAYFQQVLAERTHPKTAAGHAFHASQLLPQHSEEETARRAKLYAQEQADYEQKQAAQRRKQLETMRSEHPELDWDKVFAREQARTTVSEAPGPIPQEFIDKRDFDLTPYIKWARQQAQNAKTKMAESRAQLEKSSKNMPPRLADVESQRHILARFAEVVPVQSADQSTDKPLPADATIEAKQAHMHRMMLQSQRRTRQLSPGVMPKQQVSADGAALLRQQVIACVKKGESLAGRDLFGADLSGLDLSGQDLRDVMLEKADLTGANLTGCWCDGLVLTEAQLERARLDRCRFIRANLSRINSAFVSCTEAVFDHAVMIESHFEQSCFERAHFSQMSIVTSDFSGGLFCKSEWISVRLIQLGLTDTQWQEATLTLCTLLECILTASQWIQASLTRCALLKTTLAQAEFAGVKAQRVQIDVTDCCETVGFDKGHWEYCSFRNLHLVGCRLTASVFQRCDFTGAHLDKCDLQNSLWHSSLIFQGNIINSQLNSALFYQSNLRKTRFVDCNLSAVTFHQTNLREVDFKHCEMRRVQRYPLPSLKG
ncbi:DUF2169 family type VI secretion system accessory protein [Vibrio gazogenes]|uniref:DUF2169 domain-containing protein n=1 Tax=Vibrio gazogenes TaxID=687 RepID=A0A1Z2SJM4_VIBGA|nr:DUF2169 domain-containing protein [Vibrio gazogenes]ASA57325.1 hypothetical protein BSQ33_16190 [Vibrio gazogenes]